MNSPLSIEVKNLNHLGIVAGIIDEIGLVDQINKILGQHPQSKVSAGQAVKAMILNGLGFVSGTLYMFPKYMDSYACEHLIGEGVLPEHLNDDRLGRVLDQLYLKGLSGIFTLIALAAVKKYGVDLSSLHLDSSSLHLHGEYKTGLPEVAFERNAPTENEDKLLELAPQPINITYGYSRDHRPDLKQFILELICSSDGDIPIFLKAASGNQSDTKTFAKTLVNFRENIDIDALMVADSALYSAENLNLMKSLKWLCRVPLTVGLAKQILLGIDSKDLIQSEITGYSYIVKSSNYAGIEQRWLIVESQERKKADSKQLMRRVQQAQINAHQKLTKLCNEEFACHRDAKKAALHLSEQLKYHCLAEIKISKKQLKPQGKNKNNNQNDWKYYYQISAQLEQDKAAIELENRASGKFILATNIIDESQLSHTDMIKEYKAQQSCERGFAFLKDPLFLTDSIFIKSPERIEALSMIMGLCLLVYTLGQRQLRGILLAQNQEIKNQLGKPTDRPTLRWIFQCFQGIHLLIVNSVSQISNLSDERLWILQFFPSTCRRYYLLV
ncbi:IS1634 family transposase [Nostoc sp. C052]|uniref:IS1634 family transposase n=1 Tax=Nostoc sp. C052 TaxID=2576902 RepID=UPI0015C40A8A|nr:IS1634 family transposase [Nostoc sp. C052]QLE39391.1 IS1634 family transposase [Nostoc sp. C052]QLE40654.1 IS1634 family transposase [Nostoc sp. C052]QLE40919.1 IS1634 family transposase [Nostoc sp. C052]QLE41068.1 IS1634 family transposase [Nostoc sp. C052]QLE43851.1 IS1634 family transposase [Nostoc sp. C052]